MNNYFKISEFIIAPNMDLIPLHVADKIVEKHLPILNPIREVLDVPVIISKHSGYRSVKWEKEHGRSGDSQHTFSGYGAADIRSNERLEELLDLLKASNYKRVCYYPYHGFVHCDFKGSIKIYFTADRAGKWNYESERK